jgi:L-fuconolactonase
MQCNRRQFGQQSAQAMIAAGVLCSKIWADPQRGQGAETADLGELSRIPIVDTHQHLWDLERFRLPWLKPGQPLAHNCLPTDYREAIRGLNVVHAVYMEVDLAEEQETAEALYVTDLCRRGEGPTCAAVVGGRPGQEQFGAYIGRFKGSPYIKGVRQLLFRAEPNKPFFLEPAFAGGVRLLGELGMSFDLCLPAAMLSAGARLVDDCRGTRFILDHCGNADVKVFQAAASSDASTTARKQVEQWRQGIAELAQRPNVVCKISGIIATVPRTGWSATDLAPIVNHCLECFGPDRVMFGGDWPVCTRNGDTLRRWVEVLLEIVHNRNEAEQRKLFAENAIRFYALPQ